MPGSMDQRWYFKLPDFSNQNKWIEDKRLGFILILPIGRFYFASWKTVPMGWRWNRHFQDAIEAIRR